MQSTNLQALLGRLVRVCNSAPVVGRPLHLARFIQQNYCVLRWIFAAAIPLWLVTLLAQYQFATRDTMPAVLSLGSRVPITPQTLVIVPIIIGITSALVVLMFPRKPSSIIKILTVAFLGGAGVLVSEGLQLGFSHGDTMQMPSFALANLVLLAILPLRTWQLFSLAAFSSAVPLSVAVGTGLSPSAIYQFVAVLTLPLGAAVIGITLNRWHYRYFRQRTLGELLLQRRTQRVEQQKREIERQRSEAIAQKEEADQNRKLAEDQRTRAWNLLASALTTPIADQYERQGHVEASMKNVVIVSCDAVNFSMTCEKLQPERIVDELRWFFQKHDEACLGLGVEPLRAQGDGRISVAGLGMGGRCAPMHQAAIGAVLAMLVFRRWLPSKDSLDSSRDVESSDEKAMWPARIGINLGPVAAGVIDTTPKKLNIAQQRPGRLWFDVWGDTVNVATRLAQAARPNQILTRERLLWETGGLFEHGPFHQRQIKKNIIPDCVEITGIRREYCDDKGEPNQAFWEVFNREDYRPAAPDPKGTVLNSETAISNGQYSVSDQKKDM